MMLFAWRLVESRFDAMRVSVALDVWKFLIVESIFAESTALAARRNDAIVAVRLRFCSAAIALSWTESWAAFADSVAAFAIDRRMSRNPPLATSSAFSVRTIRFTVPAIESTLFSIAWMSVSPGPTGTVSLGAKYTRLGPFGVSAIAASPKMPIGLTLATEF